MTRIMGEEHPFCDFGQFLFIGLFILVWLVDSFWLHWSTFFLGPIHWVIRVSLSFICLIFGIYLEKGAHETLFDESSTISKVIDWGVFSLVRHPTYLGVLLILMGLFFWSFSLISFFIWLGFFFFYDQMASYEEKDLIRLFGKDYEKYQKETGKWLPKRARKR